VQRRSSLAAGRTFVLGLRLERGNNKDWHAYGLHEVCIEADGTGSCHVRRCAVHRAPNVLDRWSGFAPLVRHEPTTKLWFCIIHHETS